MFQRRCPSQKVREKVSTPPNFHQSHHQHGVDVDALAFEMKLHMNSGHPITFILQRPLLQGDQGDNVSRHTVVDSLAAFYIFHHSSQPPH